MLLQYTLSFRAFCAWEEDIPVDLSAEQQQIRLLKEYQHKLLIIGHQYADPMTSKVAWKGEKLGMVLWPSVYIMDISNYLNSTTSRPLIERLLNEYKEGKAYRYFSGEWVKEIFIDTVSETSPMCFVKAKVTPSQAVKSKAYDVWIAISKDKTDSPGGHIRSAHCACVAGMLGSCNHIAGVLFRIEYAVKTGKTKQVSTEKLCQWSIPKRTNIQPGKAANFMWKKTHYLKLPIDNIKESKKMAEKKLFTPMTKAQEKQLGNQDAVRNQIFEAMKCDMPNSCFTLLMNKQKPSCTSKKYIAPPSFLKTAENVNSINNLTHAEKKVKFLEGIVLSDEQFESLSRGTVEQGNSYEWKEQRKGRITASNFHRVCKRAKSLRNDENEDPTSMLNLIMGTSETLQTKAMKHGVSLEPVAKKVFLKEMKQSHKQFRIEEVGLVVLKDKPYIGASPDLLTSCVCCGEGLCEVKCPEIIKDVSPSPDNVPYITKKNGLVQLKTNHPYYYQIQGQLGVTGRNYCDLFIFTYHGHLTLRIIKDDEFIKSVFEDCQWIWEKYIIDKLLM